MLCHAFATETILLERLVWAVFDGILAVRATPDLLGSTMWDRVVQGIALYLLYHSKMATKHCPPQTAGSFYTQEKGTVPRQTLRSHHQGLEPQPNNSRGATAPGRYQSMLPAGYPQE